MLTNISGSFKDRYLQIKGADVGFRLLVISGRRARKFLALLFIFIVAIFYLIWIGTANYVNPGLYGTEAESLPTVPTSFEEVRSVCSVQYTDKRLYIQNRPKEDYKDLPVIYFITPTYPRGQQVAELTRLYNTLLHVPRIHWVLANDLKTCNIFLDYMLNKFEIPFTHLASPMPKKYRTAKHNPRGVSNRRAALEWVRQENITDGIIYFGDDDNTYDLKLFSEIRSTKRVSMFPVGLIASFSISGPVVRKGKVIGFLDSWVAGRRWPVDMAGFAVNLGYMAKFPNASMPYKEGYEEDLFLRSIGLKIDYIEPKGNNGTEILVWHTQTRNRNIALIQINPEYLDDRSNLGELFKTLEHMGVAKAVNNDKGESAIISKNGKRKPIDYFFS